MKRARTLCGALLVAISITLVSSASAAHPGRNGLIAYVSDGAIYTMYPDGSHRKKLNVTMEGGSQGQVGAAAYPTWSPDGRRLAFLAVGMPGGEPDGIWVFVANADGTGGKTIALVAATFNLADRGGLSWSPDGSQVAYTGGVGQNRGIGVASLDQPFHSRFLVDGYDPAWSPDGRTIVFGAWSGLDAIDPDGSARRRLDPGVAGARPDWSPDGSKVIFDTGFGSGNQIREVNADGSGMRILFEPAETLAGGYDAAWSPDGSKIVITREPPAGPELEYLQADGTTRALGSTSLAMMPDWQPCGQGTKCPDMTPCVVPPVTGLSLTRARTALRKAHCTVGTVKRLRHVALGKAVVSKQSPRVKSRLPNGGKVNLVLRPRR